MVLLHKGSNTVSMAVFFAQQFPTLLNISFPFFYSSLQRAGQVGATGPSAARSVAAESRCAAEPASHKMEFVREQWRKAVPATLIRALVSYNLVIKSETLMQVFGL